MSSAARTADAPTYRFFRSQVARTEPIGANLVRVTLAGEQLAGFGAAGDDQRIKLVVPRPGQPLPEVLAEGKGWQQALQSLPDDRRPFVRTYTVRASRPSDCELDIDLVLHGLEDGHAGPASRWAADAQPGDDAVVLGPDRPGGGRPWGCEWRPPPGARHLLLAGDETAVPAIGAILEQLPPGRAVTACLEVGHPGDIQHWQVAPGVDVRWVVRGSASEAAHGTSLTLAVRDAVTEIRGLERPRATDCAQWSRQARPTGPDSSDELLWDVPEATDPGDEMYAWLAGEAGAIKNLRRLLINDIGLPRASVAFMGYWREGAREGQ